MAKTLEIQKLAVWARVALVLLVLNFCGGKMVQAFSEMGAPAILKKLAAEYSEKGFRLRKEHWSGKLKAGEYKVVKHQLFRGNEYWFWAAIPNAEHELKVEIFDGSGNAVALERFSNKGTSGARVLPVKTGTYLVKIVLGQKAGVKEESENFDWALVYGYR